MTLVATSRDWHRAMAHANWVAGAYRVIFSERRRCRVSRSATGYWYVYLIT